MHLCLSLHRQETKVTSCFDHNALCGCTWGVGRCGYQRQHHDARPRLRLQPRRRESDLPSQQGERDSAYLFAGGGKTLTTLGAPDATTSQGRERIACPLKGPRIGPLHSCQRPMALADSLPGVPAICELIGASCAFMAQVLARSARAGDISGQS